MHSKDQIKHKYGINENDFQILTQNEKPSPDALLKEGAFIEKKGFWDGFEVWLKRTIVGNLLLAVIFIGGVLTGLDEINKYANIVYTKREQIINYSEQIGRASCRE